MTASEGPTIERVVVVEDDPTLRAALADVLRAHGYDVMTSPDGLHALGTLRREPVDAVITDLQMPVLGGEDLVRRVRMEFPSVPVIVITGAGSLADRVAVVQAGAADYLLKPFTTAAILGSLRRALAGSRAQREPRLEMAENMGDPGGLAGQPRDATERGSADAAGHAPGSPSLPPHARRVLLAAPQPFYTDRGTPIAVRHVVRALAELGFRVDVATYPMGQDVELERVRIFRCANPLRFHHIRIGFSLKKLVLDVCLTATLWRRLRTEPYALIHAVEEAAFPAVVLGRRYGVPVLYDMQSSLPEQMAGYRPFRGAIARTLLRRWEAWLLGRVDLTVCSMGLAEEVRRTVPDRPVREWRYPSTLRSAPAAEVFAVRDQVGVAPNRPIVLYCGTFEPYQNLSVLVQAMPAVLTEVPKAVLVLVGADSAGSWEIAREASKLGLDDSVRIVERQPRERIPAFLAAADVLVSARALGANLPLKIFDYLAAGKPIVATRDCAVSALLTPERAVLVDARPDEMAWAIAGLLRDRPRANRLARRAREYAERHLDWSRFVHAVSSFTAEAAAR